jgi:hypothetical protein
MTANIPPDRPLRILMATTSFPADAKDWKGRFIHDLSTSLARIPEIHLSLWGPPGDLPDGVNSANQPADDNWLAEMSHAGGIAHLLRMRPMTGLRYAAGIVSRLRRACEQAGADVYHLSWLQLALGLPNDDKPAYISVLGSDYGLLKIPGMAYALRQRLACREAVLAPNAEWMAVELRRKFGDIAEVRPNLFGVTPDWFDVNRYPSTPPEWLVVSRITRAKLGDLSEWGEGLFGAQRRLQLLGPMQESIQLPDWIEHAGATNPSALRERWFPKAAGLLTLSRHNEGRPQVLIEAMAAGLPVIASRIPAHEDLVRHGETGWLVDNKDELRDALREAERPEQNLQIGHAARDWVGQTLGTWDDCAQRCVGTYRKTLARKLDRVD